MKISVIVPTYKPQAYLWECLDSIYKQTLPKDDYELILVLNGCKDPYDSQIKNWLVAHNEMQVQYFQTDLSGVSNARNIALDNAKGEYITFIDDDDFISPSYLEELYEKASPDTVSLCYPYAFNDGEPEKQLEYRITDAYEYCIKHGCNNLSSRARKFFSAPWMKLIPMSFIQDRRFDVRFKNGEDCLFMFLISDKIKSVSFTSREAIYYRRIRSDSAESSKRSVSNRFMNDVKLSKEYAILYRGGGYSTYFFAARLLAIIRDILGMPINIIKAKSTMY